MIYLLDANTYIGFLNGTSERIRHHVETVTVRSGSSFRKGASRGSTAGKASNPDPSHNLQIRPSSVV